MQSLFAEISPESFHSPKSRTLREKADYSPVISVFSPRFLRAAGRFSKKSKKTKIAIDIMGALCYTVTCSERNARVAELADAHV